MTEINDFFFYAEKLMNKPCQFDRVEVYLQQSRLTKQRSRINKKKKNKKTPHLCSPLLETPALADLQLTTVGSDAVQVDWKASVDVPSGYLLTWEGQQSSDAGQRLSIYLPPESQSTRLTNLPPSARVCVSPIYHTARGDGLCCTARFHSGTWWFSIQLLQFYIHIRFLHKL